MRLVIIGASGLVGHNCFKYFIEQGVDVVGTHLKFKTPDTHFFDTLDPDNQNNYDLNAFKPTHILHAGALTHVDFCEENPGDSYRQTVDSTRNVLASAKEVSAKVIYISTDYI